MTPQQAVLPADSYAALLAGSTDRRTGTILAVNICRACGFAVRLSPVSQEPEQYSGMSYVPLFSQENPKADLTLQKQTSASMIQRIHFTLGKLEQGAYKTLSLPQEAIDGEKEIALCDGNYRLLTGIRQIDGSILASAEYFQLKHGEHKTLTMSLPVNRMDGKLHHYALPVMNIESLPGESVNLSQLFVNGGILSVVVPGQEPTEHLLLESAQLCSRIIREKRHILFLVRNQADAAHPAIARLLQLLGGNASIAILRDTDVLMQMRQTLRVGDSRLPFSMAVNRRSKILYAYANYNIGTVETLLDILKNDTGGATEAEPAQSPAR